MKTILFSPIAFNLAETTRAVEVAKIISNDFDCHFVSYGGAYEPMLEESGFRLTRLEPRLTPQTIQKLYAFDHGRWIGAPYSFDAVRQMVLGELELFKRIKPAAVVTGTHPSNCISCPAAQIPLVCIVQSGMALNTAARRGRLKNMDVLDAVPIRWLPGGIRAKLSEWLLDIVLEVAARPFNQLAGEYGMKPIQHVEDFFLAGYHLLVTEPPGFSDPVFPPTAHFVGPLIAHLDRVLPEEVLNLPRDLPLIYFTMGSTGHPDIIARIIEGFKGKPYRVIAPVKDLLGQRSVRIPENVLVTGLLPALEANRLADIAVIHGGIGSIMITCLAGKPAVGIAMSPEQLINLENLAAKGFALRIPQRELNAETLCHSIERLLADRVAQQKARAYQEEVEKWHSPELIRSFFCRTFG